MAAIELYDDSATTAQGGGRLRGSGGAAHVVLTDPVTGEIGGGAITQAIPDLEDPVAIAAQWDNFSGVNWAGGDFVTAVAGLNGQSITVLSGNPLTTGESSVVNTNKAVMQPCALEFAGSFVRPGVSFATAALFANDPVTGPDPVPPPINIISCYQSSSTLGAAYNAVAGTVMHITLETALPSAGTNQGVFVGDWINIDGLVDNRMCYPNACINYISPDRKTIAVGFSSESALPSLAIPVVTPPLGSAKVYFYNNFSGARNAFGLRFTAVTATSAAIVSIFGGDDNQVSGSLLGDHRTTIASSSPAYVATPNWGQYEVKASSRYRLECTPDASLLLDKGEQVNTYWNARDTPRTSVKPSGAVAMYPRFRLYKPKSMSRPVAKILSISKSGTTTATVTFVEAPTQPLVVGNTVTLYGMRDQTNFVASTGLITAVLSSTQIQMVVGSAVTATSYGGSCSIINGGAVLPGIIGQTVQSVQSRVAEGGNWLDVVGNAAWTGVNPGDYVNLYGARNSTDGGDVGVDGVWEVAHVSTTTAVLRPVYDIAGNRISPTLGTLALTNCGGNLILRPTLRSHDISLTSWSESRVQLDGQGTNRSDKAMPTYGMGGTMGVSQTTRGTVGAGWYVEPDNLLVNDIASAAFTTVGLLAGSTITPTPVGGAAEFNVVVSAVTGTSPTLDVVIQESDDTGTNWYDIYQFPRITATGIYRTPVLPLSGNRIRYQRTGGGTTPSFTMAVNRITHQMVSPAPYRQIFDRAVVNTTLNATTASLKTNGSKNLQVVLNMGVITTTAPQFQLEGSDDNGATWYSLGAPLTGVASSTVQVTVSNANAELVRARVSTAGVAATLGYVLLKAWG